MIKTLHIQNYALIQSLDVSFGEGLNIITGETGAGKSIIVDALGILLGAKATTEIIRKDADKAVIEGIFEIKNNPKVYDLLISNELDANDDLILRREISLRGANRCFINDTPVTLALLREIGDLLVDLHGQHEHQSLLRAETHIFFLDDFIGNGAAVAEYANDYYLLAKHIRDLKELQTKETERRQKLDYITFQLNEINAVTPLENEDEQLSQELKILENSEKIIELAQTTNSVLYENEHSAIGLLTNARNNLRELTNFNPALSSLLEELESALAQVDDVAASLRGFQNQIDLDPQRLESMRTRLSSLQLLKKKYGGTLKAVLELHTELLKESELTQNFGVIKKDLSEKIALVRKSVTAKAQSLSKERKSTAKKIAKEILSVLAELGIPKASFEVRIEHNKISSISDDELVDENGFLLNPRGTDTVEFFISANPGEDMKPLQKVASGGEISRIMLSLKTILAKNDKLPVLIFDEIDSGISGRVASKVGFALRDLSRFHQIIAITHLPQIAAVSNSHYCVEKAEQGGRTQSAIRQLNEDEKIIEIAKLLSGEKVTEASLNSARELISKN